MASLPIRIHEVFGPTVQGEGYWAGHACDFIRLYGCPVGCSWCDTGYSDGGKDITPLTLDFAEIEPQLTQPSVIVSGGEPFIHKSLEALIHLLHGLNKSVHIETSGAMFRSVNADWITLSPKQHLNGRYQIPVEAWRDASEIKLVVSDGSELKYYDSQLKAATQPIYLQPEWTQIKTTLPIVLNLIYESKGRYKLSIQCHKFIGVQ